MHEGYVEGTEDEPNFHIVTRDPEWKFKYEPVPEMAYF
jgi:hypothetical protein